MIDFFTDPVLRDAMWGSMLMALVTSYLGVILFVRKELLMGEVLSHAAYPGMMAGMLLGTPFVWMGSGGGGASLLIGAFGSTALALYIQPLLHKYGQIREDSALCLTLSLMMGVGVLIASRVEFIDPTRYQQVKVFLYGQATTVGRGEVQFYVGLTLVLTCLIMTHFRLVEMVLFDPNLAHTMRIRKRLMEQLIFCMLLSVLVLGLRIVGVVLMSGMLIAPVVAARQLTSRLASCLMLSALTAVAGAIVGNLLSYYLPLWLGIEGVALPTGPTIILTSCTFAVLTLLLAPRSGLLVRIGRILIFRWSIGCENVIKFFFGKQEVEIGELRRCLQLAPWRLILTLASLKRGGWLMLEENKWRLTREGQKRSERLVRVHRLWELYLTSELKIDQGRVHRSAEEMEHILTPALERQLQELLDNPAHDPHARPIPLKQDNPCW